MRKANVAGAVRQRVDILLGNAGGVYAAKVRGAVREPATRGVSAWARRSAAPNQPGLAGIFATDPASASACIGGAQDSPEMRRTCGLARYARRRYQVTAKAHAVDVNGTRSRIPLLAIVRGDEGDRPTRARPGAADRRRPGRTRGRVRMGHRLRLSRRVTSSDAEARVPSPVQQPESRAQGTRLRVGRADQHLAAIGEVEILVPGAAVAYGHRLTCIGVKK